MRIGVLALQGAFIEHEHALSDLGAETFEIRELRDIKRSFDGLVLPGGESTVQGKLLNELGLMEPLRGMIKDGLPVLATCAGLILLAQSIENDKASWLATLPVEVRRNAYGRQLGSFHAEAEYEGVGVVPMTFIRAPVIARALPGAKIAAKVGDDIAAVECGRQMALAFHPELDPDRRIHERFLKLAA
jgi:5'-phosphate synthase pdxT subunit